MENCCAAVVIINIIIIINNKCLELDFHEIYREILLLKYTFSPPTSSVTTHEGSVLTLAVIRQPVQP